MSHQISLNLIYLRHCSFICQQEKKMRVKYTLILEKLNVGRERIDEI